MGGWGGGGGGILLCADPKKIQVGRGKTQTKYNSIWRGVRYLLSEILLLELNKFEFSRPPYVRTCTCGINDKENKIP